MTLDAPGASCACAAFGPLHLRQILCPRTDHNSLMVLVVCDRCHHKQANDEGCERCGNPHGRYA